MRRRTAVLAALLAAVLAVTAAGVVAYTRMDKSVTLTVDGEPRTVSGFVSTVADVLAAEGITTGSHDIVAPAPATKIGDGDRVTVRFGRPLVLEVDGRDRQLWVTAQTVDEALDQLNVRADGAYLSTSRSARIGREGLTLTMRTPRAVTIVADGKRRTVTTTAATVGDVLRTTKLPVGRHDRVRPAATTWPAAGQVVVVNRVTPRRVVTTRALDFRTVRAETNGLYEGQERTARAGRAGRETLTWFDVAVDGRRVEHRLLARRLVASPVNRIVLVGIKERPAPRPAPAPVRSDNDTASSDSSSNDDNGSSSNGSSSNDNSTGSSGGGLNWGALAQCESGGNPQAVNPSGRYFGLYQFSISTWQSVGGSGRPDQASPSEQTRRAQILYSRTGPSSWPSCGPRLFS